MERQVAALRRSQLSDVGSSSIDCNLVTLFNTFNLEQLGNSPIGNSKLFDVLAADDSSAIYEEHADNVSCLLHHRLVCVMLIFENRLRKVVE